MKKKLRKVKNDVDIENGPWHVPSVATKKASTIKSTIKMKTIAKPKAPMKLSELTEARDRLFELKAIQNEARDEELRIREYLAKKLHDGTEGAKSVTIEGVKVTVTRNLNRTIDVAEAERLSQEQSAVALACLRWKAEIKISAYKEHTAIMDEYITTKPGPPTVTFK